MSTEYIVSKNQDSTNGIVGLSTAVFEAIARCSLEEVAEVQICENTSFRKGVSCKIEESAIVLTLNMNVKTGVNVNSVCANCQSKVYGDVKLMTDYSNVVVNINVLGFFYSKQVK